MPVGYVDYHFVSFAHALCFCFICDLLHRDRIANLTPIIICAHNNIFQPKSFLNCGLIRNSQGKMCECQIVARGIGWLVVAERKTHG